MARRAALLTAPAAPPKPPTKLLHTIPATRELLGGAGLSTIYKLVEAGKLELVKLGSRSLITDKSVKDLVASLPRTVDAPRGRAARS